MSDKKKPKKKPDSEEEKDSSPEEEEKSEGEEEEEDTSEEEEEEDEDEDEDEKEKPAKGKGGSEKKLVSSKSHVAGGRALSEVKKTWFGSSDVITIESSVSSSPAKSGSSVDIHVNIKNGSGKTVRSIQCWLRQFKGMPKGKRAKKKRPTPIKVDNTDQEYFQGARFPLQGWVDYDGDITFPLPDSLTKTKEDNTYEIVLNFPVAGGIGRGTQVKAFLPVTISS